MSQYKFCLRVDELKLNFKNAINFIEDLDFKYLSNFYKIDSTQREKVLRFEISYPISKKYKDTLGQYVSRISIGCDFLEERIWVDEVGKSEEDVTRVLSQEKDGILEIVNYGEFLEILYGDALDYLSIECNDSRDMLSKYNVIKNCICNQTEIIPKFQMIDDYGYLKTQELTKFYLLNPKSPLFDDNIFNKVKKLVCAFFSDTSKDIEWIKDEKGIHLMYMNFEISSFDFFGSGLSNFLQIIPQILKLSNEGNIIILPLKSRLFNSLHVLLRQKLLKVLSNIVRQEGSVVISPELYVFSDLKGNYIFPENTDIGKVDRIFLNP